MPQRAMSPDCLQHRIPSNGPHRPQPRPNRSLLHPNWSKVIRIWSKGPSNNSAQKKLQRSSLHCSSQVQAKDRMQGRCQKAPGGAGGSPCWGMLLMQQFPMVHHCKLSHVNVIAVSCGESVCSSLQAESSSSAVVPPAIHVMTILMVHSTWFKTVLREGVCDASQSNAQRKKNSKQYG